MTDNNAAYDNVDDNEQVTRAGADGSVALWRATRDLMWPYHYRRYPGRTKAAAINLSYHHRTVERWAFSGGPGVSVDAAQRIERHLRQHASRALALAEAWHSYSETRKATWTPPPYFRAARLAERDGWRSKKK